MASLSSKALKQIVKELQKLQQDPPEDIQVIVNDENLTEIQAWIRGPGKNQTRSSIALHVVD
jgi:ubiquitin-conjugating enzyme E2 S